MGAHRVRSYVHVPPCEARGDVGQSRHFFGGLSPQMSDSEPVSGPQNTVDRQQTRSSRRMTPTRRFLYALAVPLALGIVRFFWSTCRVVRVVGAEHLDAALEKSHTVIPCCWHQHQLFCLRYLLQRQGGRLRLGALASPSVDGELAAMIGQRLGIEMIRGSSTRTGARTLRDFYEALTRRGISPLITPDGPRGPRFEFKPGAVMLSQMSQRPVVPLAYAASRAILFHWDKFVIPWPFSRIVVAIGEPRQVPRVLDAAAMAREQADMKARMHATYRLADAVLHAGARGETAT